LLAPATSVNISSPKLGVAPGLKYKSPSPSNRSCWAGTSYTHRTFIGMFSRGFRMAAWSSFFLIIFVRYVHAVFSNVVMHFILVRRQSVHLVT
jgi:hypothetical protein